jgi:ankyrin repeat protein
MIFMKRTLFSALLISTFLTTAFVTNNVTAQPALPAFGAKNEKTEAPALPQLGTTTPTDANKGQIAPELALPDIIGKGKSDDIDIPELPDLAPKAASNTQPASAPVATTPPVLPAPPIVGEPVVELPIAPVAASVAAPSTPVADVPQVPDEITMPELPSFSNNVPALPNAPAQPKAATNAVPVDSGVKLSPEVPQLSNEAAREKEMNAVLDNVFGEPKKVKVEAPVLTEEPVKATATSATHTQAAEDEPEVEAIDIEDDKVITTEEIQALEAIPLDSYSEPSSKKAATKRSTAAEPFKSQTYTDAQLGNQLVTQTMSGNRANVEALVNTGININTANENLETPLMAATFTGNDNLMDFFIQRNANVNARDKNGNSALHVAISKNNARAVQKLVAAGADVNSRNIVNDTPLLLAINGNQSAIAQTLLNSGADVNASNSDGLTPLHIAAYNNNVELVKNLLAKGANKYTASRQGLTPYDIAAARSPEAAIILAPAKESIVNPQLSDSSSQLSMFPKELVAEPEQPAANSGWWAEQASSEATPAPVASANQQAQFNTIPAAELQPVEAQVIPAAEYSDIQNIPLSLRFRNSGAVATSLNQQATLPATPTAQIVSTTVNSPEYNPELNAEIQAAIKGNAVPAVNTSAAPTVPVQGLTRVSYEAERIVTEVPAPYAAPVSPQAAPASLQFAPQPAPAATFASQPQAPQVLAPQPEPIQNIAPVEAPSVMPAQNVPTSLRFRNSASANPVVQPVSQPQYAPVTQAPVSLQQPSAELQQLTATSPSVRSAPVQQVEVGSVNDIDETIAAASPQPQNLASTFASDSPVRNLNRVDYAAFYNNSSTSTSASVEAAPSSISSAVKPVSAVLSQDYSSMGSVEKAQWDSRLRSYLSEKNAGTESAETLAKKERILKAIYKDGFDAAVVAAQ